MDSEQFARRSALLEYSAERVFFVLIQREAMKLSGYESFFEDYNISNEVRMRMAGRSYQTSG